MPYSSPVFDQQIKKIIKKINPQNCLDIGSGAGKYGTIIKKLLPEAKITGIEIEKDYVYKFKLKNIYDEVWNMSVMELIQPKYFEKNFDLVFVGDIIEHLKKSEGIDLLNFLVYRSKFILIVFPHKYLQNAVNGYPSEAHISVWSKYDFDSFETTKLFTNKNIRLILIKGYLKSLIKVENLNKI